MEKSPKKWSLGNILFRKSKKDTPQADFSSDEDDRKAGFGDFVKKSPSKAKTNKHLVQSFDQQQYSVANPEFHYFKPSLQQKQQQQPPPQQQVNQHYRQPQIYANQNNLEFINNQINLEKNRIAQPQYIYSNNNNYHYQGSSQDEKSSYNSLSSPVNKNDSETGSRTSLNKRTRNARNERYYQRIMREDGRPLTVYGSVNSIENQKYQPPLNGTQNRLSASIKSSSLCSSDFMLPLSNQSQSLPIPRFRGNAEEDKDDYENIHEVDESVPPPIPPRDPNRRFSINSNSVSQHPYYFDHALQKYVIFNTNGKCFSDDKLWKNDSEMSRPLSVKADKFDNKQQQHDILRPRSRKPLNLNTNLENECVFSSEDVVDNPRYPVSQSKRSKSAVDFERLMNEPVRNKFAARQRNLTSVEPIRYQAVVQAQHHDFCNEELLALRKKYSSAEDVNKGKANANMRAKLPTANCNTPGSRKSFNAMDLKVKSNVSSNLDDAICELELMYKNLVKDEDLMERAERRDLPTPTKFSMMMRKYEEYEDEENKNDKEPDILLDDVFSRNQKHANQMLKAADPLPFGIPNQKLCPIPPKPSQDYLSIEPIQMRKSQIIVAQNNPDIIADDLAVRNLRKDNPSYSRRRNLIEIDNNHFMKRNHTLSSLSEQIYNGILKGSAKPSGGKTDDYLQHNMTRLEDDKKDVKSTLYLVNKEQQKAKRTDFEDSLNALVIESKAISQKLEKDLSKLKRESVTPAKTLVNLLDFRKSIEKEKEKKSASCSPVKLLQNSSALPVEEPSKPKVTMTSTACSPIRDFEVSSPVQEVVKSEPTKQQKAEKIENLIKMFNTTISPEPVKKTSPAKVNIEKTSRKISDLSGMFEKAPEVETKPPPQPTHAPLRKTLSNEDKFAVAPLRIISPKIVSPTVMNPKIVSPKILSPKLTSSIVEKPKHQVDVESNINNIKELIQQIKQTEFDKNQRDAVKSDILKPTQSELPDYDNIKDDYEMTDGRLERVVKPKPDFLEPLSVKIPKEPSDADENSPEVKSITTTSSSLRETSVESTSKDSPKPDYVNDSSAIYKDAIDFLHETAETKAAATTIESEHKSPIKSIRQDKDEVLSYIDKINENLVAVMKNEEREEMPKMNVKESITKLECKITLSRQNSESSEPYSTPKQLSPPPQIRPVILPKVGPSDTESLYNSSEELSMIFGIGELPAANVAVQPGKIVEEDFEAEFEKIAHDDDIVDDKLLDENFNVTLIDLNNNTDNLYDECFDNELSGMSSESAMSKAVDDLFEAVASTSPSNSSTSQNNDDNNNSLTATDLSKLNECQTNRLINRKPSTSNSSSSSFKSGGNTMSDNSSATNPPSPLKAQCILLACVYCIMLYLQFIIFNFKSSWKLFNHLMVLQIWIWSKIFLLFNSVFRNFLLLYSFSCSRLYYFAFVHNLYCYWMWNSIIMFML